MLGNFKWYRRLRGGRWAKVTGWLWGKRWVRVPQECVERVDEDWPPACKVPPPGWGCTRAPGHDGPCAAVPLCSHGRRMDERCAECQKAIRGTWPPPRSRFA